MKPTPNIVVKLKRPHAQQQAFISSKAKRRIVRAGRRSGKTTGAAILAVEEFLNGRRVLYAAPIFEQTDSFWREVRLPLADLTHAGIFRLNLSERFIEKPGTDARIKCKTAWNADSLRGDYADVLILDEWQLCNESAWEEVGAPMLLDNDGDAVFIYTPPSSRFRAVSKAKDPRHAAKMYKLAAADTSGRWKAFHFTSHDNPHISEKALSELSSDMTVLAIKQEILAEDVEEIAGSLWRQLMIDDLRVTQSPALSRIVVAIDPSTTSKETSDEAGIVVAGVTESGHGYILADLSRRDTPKGWASAAIAAYYANKADRVIAEVNQGGDLVEAVLRTIDENVSYKSIHASRGKQTRAEPVSALYEQGRVHHVGVFPELEEEQTSWVPGNPSPNRMDALVWGLTELMLGTGFGWAVEGARRWVDAGRPAISDIALQSGEVAQGGQVSDGVWKAVVAEASQRAPSGVAVDHVFGSKIFGALVGPIPGGHVAKPSSDLCPKCGKGMAGTAFIRRCICGYEERKPEQIRVR